MQKVSDSARKLKAIRQEAGLTVQAVADALDIPKSTYASNEDKYKKPYLPLDLVQKLVPIFGKRGIAKTRVMALAGLGRDELEGEPHGDSFAKGTVAGKNRKALGSTTEGLHTADGYKPLPEPVYVIGSVQAGAWREAYQLPEGEWKLMHLPEDDRFPGIPRFGLKNIGNSMDKVCRPGGTWVFIRFADVPGLGLEVDKYFIVERCHKDGTVEATAKKLGMGPDKALWLYPESDDPSYRPFPLADGDPNVEEIRVIGRVVDIVNRV